MEALHELINHIEKLTRTVASVMAVKRWLLLQAKPVLLRRCTGQTAIGAEQKRLLRLTPEAIVAEVKRMLNEVGYVPPTGQRKASQLRTGDHLTFADRLERMLDAMTTNPTQLAQLIFGKRMVSLLSPPSSSRLRGPSV